MKIILPRWRKTATGALFAEVLFWRHLSYSLLINILSVFRGLLFVVFIYLFVHPFFIYIIFYYALSVWNYTLSDATLFGEQWIKKDLEGSRDLIDILSRKVPR
jgi:hypothetical protein